MGDVGVCRDNVSVERLFGSVTHDWIFKVAQPTREPMKQDATAYNLGERFRRRYL